MSRLGRNTKDVLSVLKTIQELGMDSRSIDGKENPYRKAMLMMMSCLLYEIERKALLECTSRGIPAYDKQGGTHGRER